TALMLDYPTGFYLKVEGQTITRRRHGRNEYDCLRQAGD
ncbi:unnamed protein product, partial [marine sediment metagenome]